MLESVSDLLGVELTQFFSVEFESGPTRVETSHEDVDVDLHGISRDLGS